MVQFLWVYPGGSSLVSGESRDEAYRKVIANRMAAITGVDPDLDEDELVRKAVLGFRHNDELIEVECEEITNSPYAGSLESPIVVAGFLPGD